MEEKKLFDFDFDELGDKIKGLIGKSKELAGESKEIIQDAIDQLQGEITAGTTAAQQKAEEYKGQAFAEILEAKLKLEQQASEVKNAIAAKAEDIQEGTKGAKTQAAAKYADFMAEIAEMFNKEAAKAKLEVELARKEEEDEDEE